MPLSLKILLNAINDITTTPLAAPEFNSLNVRPYKTALASRQQKLYPGLRPFSSPLAVHELFSRAVDAAKAQLHWEVIHMDAVHYRLEATVTTPLLKFRDDVVIEVRKESNGSSLHMRSRSRLGRNDFSANYNRIKNFLMQL